MSHTSQSDTHNKNTGKRTEVTTVHTVQEHMDTQDMTRTGLPC